MLPKTVRPTPVPTSGPRLSPGVVIGLALAAACSGGKPAARPPEPEMPEGTGGVRATGGVGSPGTGGSPVMNDAAAGGGAATESGVDPSVDSGGATPWEAGATDGLSGGDAVPGNSADPKAPCPRYVRIFDGTTFAGWEAAPSTWKIVDGAMRGSGGTSRAAYTKEDYGNVRLFVTSRMNPQNGDHLGILFWGNRPNDPNSPQIDNAGWLQWMPPFGTMWSYHPPMHHFVASMKIATSPAQSTEWHTSELLLNLDKGTLRVAVNGLETTRYTHPWPTERTDPTKRIIKGPLAMMRHGGGVSEYKDIWVEVDPTEDKLLSVK